MTNRQTEEVKILFRYFSSVLDEWVVEKMWADIFNVDEGLYKLNNIPFYGPPVPSDDIVFAEYPPRFVSPRTVRLNQIHE